MTSADDLAATFKVPPQLSEIASDAHLRKNFIQLIFSGRRLVATAAAAAVTAAAADVAAGPAVAADAAAAAAGDRRVELLGIGNDVVKVVGWWSFALLRLPRHSFHRLELWEMGNKVLEQQDDARRRAIIEVSAVGRATRPAREGRIIQEKQHTNKSNEVLKLKRWKRTA